MAFNHLLTPQRREAEFSATTAESKQSTYHVMFQVFNGSNHLII